MSTPDTLPPADAVPRLPRGVRLFRDETRQQWTLLAPERILKLDDVALAILQRCDGNASISAIVDDLVATYRADRGQIDGDVREFLKDLMQKRMLEL